MIDIVLVGGGHAHLFVLEAFARAPLEGVCLTLIAKEASAPYSGMLPGRVSGQYPLDSGEIDLRRLAAKAGAGFLHAPANAIDRTHRRILVDGHSPVSYDLLSLDIGIVPNVASITGAATNSLVVKPISTFRQRLEGLLADIGEGRCRNLVVVGGGPAGFELAHALRRRTRAFAGEKSGQASVTLIAGGKLLSGLPDRGRGLARRSLERSEIVLVESARAVRIDPDTVILDNGQSLPADATLVATAAAAPPILERSGLACDGRGFVRLRETLQAEDDDRTFAAGDCGSLIGQERPKAGVFAVRQGPVLAENLRRAALGRPLVRYQAQEAYLMLLALSNGEAIAARGRLALQSHLAFRLKHWIDRGFVARFGGG